MRYLLRVAFWTWRHQRELLLLLLALLLLYGEWLCYSLAPYLSWPPLPGSEDGTESQVG